MEGLDREISTTTQVVRIRVGRRGVLTLGPGGEIQGLWRICQRELRTNEEVRAMGGGVTRHTLLAWRRKGFPEPVVRLGKLELWSRTAVEAWLEDWRSRGTSPPRG